MSNSTKRSKGSGNSGSRSSKPATILPTPVELAIIAGARGPNDNPRRAVEGAMAVYLHSKRLLDEACGLDWEALCTRFGDGELFETEALMPAAEREKLMFEPNSPGSDEVRSYLTQCGLHLKTAKAVRENLRELFMAVAEGLGKKRDDGVKEFESYMVSAAHVLKDDQPRYAIDQQLLNRLVKWKQFKRREGANRGHVKRRSRKK